MQSSNNRTYTPLANNCFYNGTPDQVLNYNSSYVNIKSDTICKINIIQSNDNKIINSTSVDYLTPNVDFIHSFNLECSYVYFQVVNNSGVDQSSLAFSVIYKTSSLSSGGAGSDVNILSPLNSGNVACQIMNAVQLQDVGVDVGSNSMLTKITNVVDVSNSNINNIYNILNSRGSVILWNGFTGLPSFTVDMSNKNIKNITIYGTVDGASLLTIQFSNNGLNWYNSQYSFNNTGAGDFGFAISACPKYLRLISNNTVNSVAYADYC
jgi:hypothetical protein